MKDDAIDEGNTVEEIGVVSEDTHGAFFGVWDGGMGYTWWG